MTSWEYIICVNLNLRMTPSHKENKMNKAGREMVTSLSNGLDPDIRTLFLNKQSSKIA